jgi:predicted metal-dependent hydrolase
LVAAVGCAHLAERVTVRWSPRARRASLRLDPVSGEMVLVYPARASARAVLAFTASKRRWIADHLAALPSPIAFVDGAEIPLHGRSHIVRFRPKDRGGVWCDDDEIFVTGRVEHGARRLKDWLKQ